MAKATYQTNTQSHRKGDKIDFDGSKAQHQQLLKRGFITMDAVVQEKKPAGPEETKPAAPVETKRKSKNKEA